ncbi:MAG: hypothetical protein U9N83_01405 [Thermodesulfobacteriota bacterium]|nr:hypothetical protein [Thermodesulfobacteriota bacterium]
MKYDLDDAKPDLGKNLEIIKPQPVLKAKRDFNLQTIINMLL